MQTNYLISALLSCSFGFLEKKSKMGNKPSLSIYSLFLVLCLFLASPTFQQQPIHWYPCPFFTNYKTSLLNSTDSLLHVQEIESTLLEIAKQQENEKLVHISQQIFGDGPTIPFEIPRLTKRNIHTILKGLKTICFVTFAFSSFFS